MRKNLSMASSDELKVSKATRTRVQRRLELASRPYIARRRNFTTSRINLADALRKAAVWTMI